MTLKNASSRSQRGFSAIELMLVVLISLIIAAWAIPAWLSMSRNFRISGDGRDLADELAVAKIQAAASFTWARARFNIAANNGLPANTYQIEFCQQKGPIPPGPGCLIWAPQGGTQYLSQGVTLGFGAVGAPPPNTTAGMAMAPACLDNVGIAIGGTACIVFNSRGVPVDAAGNPTANDAIYVTDGNAVYGATVSAIGSIRTWRSPAGAAGWVRM